MLETMMNVKNMKDLIQLASAGARGTVALEADRNWQNVFGLSSEQCVNSLVACALIKSPELECPDVLRSHLINMMKNESSANLIRQQRILNLLSEMGQAGIIAKLLKGYAVAVNYAFPESRSSVDTDILIDIRQEKQAIRFLIDRGFQVSSRSANSQHTICQHQKYGVLELHVSLYTELVRDVWFDKLDVSSLVTEPDVEIKTPMGCFDTLGYTDHLIFLALHMVQHFILDGITLRMMLDLVLYISKNCSEIDMERFWTKLEQLNYRTFISCVIWCMVYYGGFNEIEFQGLQTVPRNQVDYLLEDILCGGYMGVKEKDDRHSGAMEYNRQIMQSKVSPWQYRVYMLRLKIRSGANKMFLSKQELAKEYPATSKVVFAFPFVWLFQIIAYPCKKIHAGVLQKSIRTSQSYVPEVAERRLKLFRDLEMM